ncbi:MAG: aromatic aminobenezylarsenical efflux permease ArsG family transporter [Bacteroidales bacterium]|nr:aromatic aminobenezylarsenical efflux permease ArsG family transporter [Bacteroidales bacterium]
MNELLNLAQNSSSPLIGVLLLGIVFGLDPCAMLTNIAAMGYIGKDLDNKHRVFRNGLLYTLGRTLAFGVLGITLIILLRLGGNVSAIQDFMTEYGEIILIPLLIITGLLLIFADKISFLNISYSAENFSNQAKKGGWGAFVLGLLLSLGFCPTNAIIFFGMMVPMGATSSYGLLLPIIFAIVTALPVVIIAWLLAFSLNNINQFYAKAKNIGKWARWIVGILFIAVGIYFAVEHLSEDGCHHHDTEECDHHHHHCNHQHTHINEFLR